jgi:poly(hydroxyalkanoate) granule-associated protein
MATENGKTPLIVVEEEWVDAQDNLKQQARRLFLASLGMFAYGQEKLQTVQERAGTLLDELVERGESIEKESRQRLDKVVENRKKRARRVADKAESRIDNQLEEMVARMNLPTRNDLKALNNRLNTLNRKLDELKTARAG